MLRFCDFVPFHKVIQEAGFFSDQVEQAGTFADAVRMAGDWLRQHGLKPIQIETVVLPNIWEEAGSQDPALHVQTTGDSNKRFARWHQFIRVWYDDEPQPPPYR